MFNGENDHVVLASHKASIDGLQQWATRLEKALGLETVTRQDGEKVFLKTDVEPVKGYIDVKE
tara:strand:+ start:12413 stop:12601 length:189 start_codon:yes stop_codon:yes gene_type:complete